MMLQTNNNAHTKKIKSISGIYDGINFPNGALLCRHLCLMFIVQASGLKTLYHIFFQCCLQKCLFAIQPLQELKNMY